MDRFCTGSQAVCNAIKSKAKNALPPKQGKNIPGFAHPLALPCARWRTIWLRPGPLFPHPTPLFHMRLLHTMLCVGDLDRSIHFYTHVLGMMLLRRSENPEYKYTLAFLGYEGGNPGQAEIEPAKIGRASCRERV